LSVPDPAERKASPAPPGPAACRRPAAFTAAGSIDSASCSSFSRAISSAPLSACPTRAPIHDLMLFVVMFVAATNSSAEGIREKQMKMMTRRERIFDPRMFLRRSSRILNRFRVTRKISRTTRMTFRLISAKTTMLPENATVSPDATR